MLPLKAHRHFTSTYIWIVVCCGALAIADSLYEFYSHPAGYQWFILAALTLISGSATVKLPSVPATISVSETFIFASVILLGVPAGTLTVVLDGLVMSLWQGSKRQKPVRVLFNVSSTALSVWSGATLFFWASGVKPLIQEPAQIGELLLPLVLFALVYFSLNSWLITFAISLENGSRPIDIWTKNFAWISLSYFSGASVAALLVLYTRDLDLTFLGVILPLLFVLYLTFRTAMGRVEDANRHLAQLNNLYLSTIETLAMAIDAKDQITHGHIRRVQTYAVGLARAMGLTREADLKAIEAAALLHDMGKLAVPEYILNKPGKLTAAEFEKMKLHATIGADILSAIDFPYPVVPIVRHHHENWDGKGYPAGLEGEDIPVGARILSVVDCFDALTSDRPYRPRLSDADALQILHERRGNMYDPEVVDTFARVYLDIAPDNVQAPVEKAVTVLADAAQPTAPPLAVSPLEGISASAEEMLTLYDLARALAGQTTLADAGDVIAKHLRRILPAAVCAFYTYDSATDDLVATHASGKGAEAVEGLRIALGERLTGWVGANRQTILNSDPALDLGEAARSLDPRLRSSLSTPLMAGGTLVGVLTLYSTSPNAFTEDHRRILEVISRQVSQTVRHALDFEKVRTTALRDRLTGLPNLEQLDRFIASEGRLEGPMVLPIGLLFVDVHGLGAINARFGRPAGDQVLSHVATRARQALRGADILFRYGGDEFVVVLPQTDPATARCIAERLQQVVSDTTLVLADGSRVRPVVEIEIGTAPGDAASLPELLGLARIRALPKQLLTEPSTPALTAVH